MGKVSRRSVVGLSLLGGACARLSPKAGSVAVPVGSCELYVSAGQVVPSFSDTRQAVQDFDGCTGFPYAALYIEKSANCSSCGKCIRLWQRPDGQFALYTYSKEHTDSVVVQTPHLAVTLAHAGHGNFVSLCSGYATEPITGVLLIKQERRVTFSLSLDLREQGNFAEADQARVDSALHVIRQLTHR